MMNSMKSILSSMFQLSRFTFRLLKGAVFLVCLLVFILTHTFLPLAELTASALKSLGLDPVLNASSFSVNSVGSKRDKQQQIAELETENRRLRNLNSVVLNGEKLTVQQASNRIAGRVQKRTAAVATANAASVFGEAIPLWGIAIIAGSTSYELYSACQTMKDMQSLRKSLGQTSDSETIEETERICGLERPTADEIWAQVKESPGQAWQGAVSAADGAGEWYGSLDTPDFGGWYTTGLGWLSDVSPW